MNVFEDTYLADILHLVSQGLLVPTLVAIIIMLCATAFFVGQVLVEFFATRRGRGMRGGAEELIGSIEEAPEDRLCAVVDESPLFNAQKEPLEAVVRNRELPEEALFSLAELEVGRLRERYQKRLGWTDVLAKVAPLLGLMGTLIPLGPGIVALGQNDPTLLSQSLLVAFDATVCGLVCAIAALIISKVRSRWYAGDLKTLEALMNCVLEKVEASTHG